MRAALTMDVLATDLADYLVRKGVRFSRTGTQSPRLMTPHSFIGTLSRDASRFWTRCGLGRGAPVPARRALGTRLQIAARQV